MSNIAGLFHPWEREPERGGWHTVVEKHRERGSGVREPREGATEGGAPIHQRPSTLAFPPLSFFSTVRAPSFRVTSALFHPSFLPPPGSDTVPWLCFSLFRGALASLHRFHDFADTTTLSSHLPPSLSLLHVLSFSGYHHPSRGQSYATDCTFQIH